MAVGMSAVVVPVSVGMGGMSRVVIMVSVSMGVMLVGMVLVGVGRVLVGVRTFVGMGVGQFTGSVGMGTGLMASALPPLGN